MEDKKFFDETIPNNLDIENDRDLIFPKFPLEQDTTVIPTFDPVKFEAINHGGEMEIEEIKKRLSALMEENNKLKETLYQNNIAMKQQFNTLSTWQKDVLKVHQRHIKRFDDTKDFIQRLLGETNTLKAELVVARNRNAECRNVIEILNKKLNQKKDDFLSLLKIDKCGQEEIEITNQSHFTELELQQQLETEKGKVETLEKRIMELEKKNLKEFKRRSQTSTKEEELSRIVEILTKRLENTERSKRQLEIDNEKLMVQKNKIEQKLLEKEANNNRTRLGKRELSSEENIFKRIDIFLAEEFTRKVAEVDSASSPDHLKLVIQDERSKLTIAKELLNLVHHHWRNQKTSSSPLNLSITQPTDHAGTTKHQSEEPNETLDEIISKVLRLEGDISAKNDQINSLKIKMKNIEAENEAIAILRSQVLVYKSEFNVERKCREDLAAERDKLLSDMRHLLRQNKQLTEQLNSVRNNREERSGDQAPLSCNISISQDEIIPSGDYTCPNPECLMRFTTVEPLQIHVEQCLKLTD